MFCRDFFNLFTKRGFYLDPAVLDFSLEQFMQQCMTKKACECVCEKVGSVCLNRAAWRRRWQSQQRGDKSLRKRSTPRKLWLVLGSRCRRHHRYRTSTSHYEKESGVPASPSPARDGKLPFLFRQDLSTIVKEKSRNFDMSPKNHSKLKDFGYQIHRHRAYSSPYLCYIMLKISLLY